MDNLLKFIWPSSTSSAKMTLSMRSTDVVSQLDESFQAVSEWKQVNHLEKIQKRVCHYILSKDYTTSQYQSTYLSDSKVVQGLLEAVLEKKAGKNFGPIAAKHLVFFLDDMNLEHSDQFGGQSGLELIRQVLDYKTWYDRSKHTTNDNPESTLQ